MMLVEVVLVEEGDGEVRERLEVSEEKGEGGEEDLGKSELGGSESEIEMALEMELMGGIPCSMNELDGECTELRRTPSSSLLSLY